MTHHQYLLTHNSSTLAFVQMPWTCRRTRHTINFLTCIYHSSTIMTMTLLSLDHVPCGCVKLQRLALVAMESLFRQVVASSLNDNFIWYQRQWESQMLAENTTKWDQVEPRYLLPILGELIHWPINTRRHLSFPPNFVLSSLHGIGRIP
jgi:hypothetical protein